jgi:hypothetical protein
VSTPFSGAKSTPRMAPTATPAAMLIIILPVVMTLLFKGEEMRSSSAEEQYKFVALRQKKGYIILSKSCVLY